MCYNHATQPKPDTTDFSSYIFSFFIYYIISNIILIYAKYLKTSYLPLLSPDKKTGNRPPVFLSISGGTFSYRSALLTTVRYRLSGRSASRCVSTGRSTGPATNSPVSRS